MTKTFTATLVPQLADEKRIREIGAGARWRLLSEIANARLRGVCAGPAAGPGEDVTADGCECSGDGRDAGNLWPPARQWEG